MISATVTSQDLARLAAAIRAEDDGAAMRRDLIRNLRIAVKPAITGAKSAIMSMPSSGLYRNTAHLRSGIAREIRSETRLTAKTAGVKVKVRKKPIRGFKNPAYSTNRVTGWRHPVFPDKGKRREVRWVQQLGKPRWFDNEMQKHREEYHAAVKAAMDQTAERIARNA